MRSSLRLLLGTRHITETRKPGGEIVSLALLELLKSYKDPHNGNREGTLNLMRQKLAERTDLFGLFIGDEHGKVKFDPNARFPVQIVIDEPLTEGGRLMADPRVLGIGAYIDQMILTLRNLPVGEVLPGDYHVDLGRIPNAPLDHPAVVEVNVEYDEPRPGIARSLKAVITTVRGDDEATHFRLFEIIRRAFVGVLPTGVTKMSDLFVGLDSIELPPPIASGPATSPDALLPDPTTHDAVTPRHADAIIVRVPDLVWDQTKPAPSVTLELASTYWNGRDPTPRAIVYCTGLNPASPSEPATFTATVVAAAPATPGAVPTPQPAPTAGHPTSS